ncbi:pH-response regulator protein palH/rim21 [Maublancomyces gigas]|uniref:PH-response regulator protein palH/rim21 n=1 Tax=Discina gigas TaxID=1032678 RepID=A0ABR3GVK3_9PEZI
MAYSISATTTLAYVLLFLLFLPNPPNSRPWLQKVATLTVVICLTIAFAETTTVLKEEYKLVGSSLYSLTNEAREVRRRVVGGTVIRVGRIISDLFLWLAQVQTLIRLFPREREKVIIKWAGFGLILLDTVFSILQSFVSPGANADSFLDAIPALSYLFQIALSLLYASCVIYYSFAKRKYSYFYPHSLFKPSTPGSKQYGGRSIVLVATLSIASVLTPIVFFLLDIAQKDIAGWGDYIRWVGAASASAVVWEWVDRIEGLEREECKGGVLGREVFDEDEEEDGFQGDGATRRRSGRRRRGHDGGGGQDCQGALGSGVPLSRATTVASASTAYAVNMRRVETVDTFLGRFPTSISSGGVSGGVSGGGGGGGVSGVSGVSGLNGGRGGATPVTTRSASTVNVQRGDTLAIEETLRESPRPMSITVDDTQSEKNLEWDDDASNSNSAPLPLPSNATNNIEVTPPTPPPIPPPPSSDPSSIWVWRKRRRRDHEHRAGTPTPSTATITTTTTTTTPSPRQRDRVQPAVPRVSLPVTIIPAPPRGAQGSWGAVERARALAEAEQAERTRIAASVELPPSRSTFRTNGGAGRGGDQ